MAQSAKEIGVYVRIWSTAVLPGGSEERGGSGGEFARPRRPGASAIPRRSSRLAAARSSRRCFRRSGAQTEKKSCQQGVREQGR
jgi:hypothetical protein